MMNEIIAWSVNLFARLAVHLRLIPVELKPKKRIRKPRYYQCALLDLRSS